MSFGEIKYAINSTLGTEDFAPLNEQHGRKIFTSNGSFVVPKGITQIRVTAIAKGGNGGNGGNGRSTYYTGGGGGGGASGMFCQNFPIDVTPQQSIPITVGSGNTVVGTFITLLIGRNGATGADAYSDPEASASTIAMGGDNTGFGSCGGDATPSRGGGFGGSVFGQFIAGGLAGQRNNSAGQAGQNGVQFGDGGGGGGGGTGVSGGVGGLGVNGIVIIEW